MEIVSLEFFFFFAVVILVFHILPARARCGFLLFASYLFYGSRDIRCLALLAVSTLVSWAGALLISHSKTRQGRRNVCISAWAFHLALLGYFKYAGFLTGGRIESLILPVGISFYLFMACGYLADEYYGRISAEKNIVRYALFVSFFPTILSGPIERAGNMLPQFSQSFLGQVRFDTDRIRDGFVRMLWGLFMKLVLADRIAILTDTVYASPQQYGGVLMAVVTVLYSFRIYCDFAGYSHMAVGIAQCLGIQVMENFKNPYLAESIPDFWRRWHISLSSWFRDYVYIPLGGNRKGTVRKYVNVMIVFLLSGLWHGAGWTFIVWGGLHGFYQVTGALLSTFNKKVAVLFGADKNRASARIVKILFTFALVNLAWIFFQAQDLTAVGQICGRFMHPRIWELFDGTICTLGLDRANVTVMFGGLVLLAVVDLLGEKGIRLSEKIASMRLWIRWPVYLAVLLFVLLCGVWGTGYDSTSFIYYRF